MLYAVISLCAALLLLLAVLLLRTLRFKPQADAPRTPTHTDFDGDKAVRDLAAMIQCRTVSDRDPAKEDAAEFEKFIKLLPTLFPRVYAACEQIETGERSLLLRWRGESPDEPLVLMSHFDVVSVVEEDWTHPAFGGVVENGILWGRGTLDTKATLNGILQAAETLLQNGFTPKRDVFLAFSGNEEVSGNGAPAIVDWLEKNNITPWAVIDEGGAVVENVLSCWEF